MILASGTFARRLRRCGRAGSIDQRWNSRGGSTPAQVSKICSTSAPALSWPSRYWIEFSTSTVDDRRERFGMAIGHHPRRRLVRRALPGHHVGRDRPRRAAEADQRDVSIELAADAAHRLEHRFEFCEVGLLAPARRPRAYPADRAAGLRRPRTARRGRARRG
jgi:hypothetical protein